MKDLNPFTSWSGVTLRAGVIRRPEVQGHIFETLRSRGYCILAVHNLIYVASLPDDVPQQLQGYESANFPFEGPDNKYLRLCGPKGKTDDLTQMQVLKPQEGQQISTNFFLMKLKI